MKAGIRSLLKRRSCLGRLHDEGYRRGKARPALRFGVQALLAFGSELVKLGAAVLFGCSPVRFEQAAQFKAMEGWVERSFFHLEQLLRGLMNPLRDGVAMQWTTGESLEDEHFQSALDEFAGVGVFFPNHLRGKLAANRQRCQLDSCG